MRENEVDETFEAAATASLALANITSVLEHTQICESAGHISVGHSFRLGTLKQRTCHFC